MATTPEQQTALFFVFAEATGVPIGAYDTAQAVFQLLFLPPDEIQARIQGWLNTVRKTRADSLLAVDEVAANTKQALTNDIAVLDALTPKR